MSDHHDHHHHGHDHHHDHGDGEAPLCHDQLNYIRKAYAVGKDGEPTYKMVVKNMEWLSDGCNKVFDTSNKLSAVVDVGCGATLHNAIVLSRYFDGVYLSDYAEVGRQLLNKWHDRKLTEFDWTPYFDILAKEEGKLPSELESRVRGAWKGVLPCDIHKPRAGLHSGVDGFPDNVDAVASISAILHNSSTLAEYQQALQNVLSLIKPGGYFIYGDMVTANSPQEHHHHHHEGDDEHGPRGAAGHHGLIADLNVEQVKEQVSKAGVTLLQFFVEDNTEHQWAEFVMIGQKV